MRGRSKTLATWLALIGGAVGLHRLYLYGPGQAITWLHLPMTAAGVVGAVRTQTLGQDDRLAWCLMPLLGLMLAQGALHAIVYGLTPDDAWRLQHDPGGEPQPTRWGPVFGAITALLLGGIVLMSTIAFAVQRFFEWQLGR